MTKLRKTIFLSERHIQMAQELADEMGINFGGIISFCITEVHNSKKIVSFKLNPSLRPVGRPKAEKKSDLQKFVDECLADNGKKSYNDLTRKNDIVRATLEAEPDKEYLVCRLVYRSEDETKFDEDNSYRMAFKPFMAFRDFEQEVKDGKIKLNEPPTQNPQI